MRASSSPFCWAFSVPVRSVTRALSGGTATSARATPSSAARTSSAAKNCRIGLTPLLRRGLAEIDLRRHGDRLLVLHREIGLGLVAEHHRREVGRKGTREHVVFLHRLDVTP